MKINEIITEDKNEQQPTLAPDQTAAIKGAVQLPGISQNSSNGSSYHQYRFGIALAGSPDIETPADGAMGGNPLLATYTDEEAEIIRVAAQMTDAGTVIPVSKNKSEEAPFVQTISPMLSRGPISLKKK